MTKTAMQAAVKAVYEARRDRATHPEGRFDGAGRWYPSSREDAGGDGSCVRSPSRAWPYSYMLRCRTRAHCRVLVERALAGLAVPADVARAVGAAVDVTQEMPAVSMAELVASGVADCH